MTKGVTTMKNINEYNEQEIRTAYEGIKLALILNASQPIVINQLIENMKLVKARAAELGINL